MTGISAAYKKAKAYVDQQLQIDRRHGRRPKISKHEYDRIVRRVARVTPRESRNGTATKAQR